jgi:hypothetical protein
LRRLRISTECISTERKNAKTYQSTSVWKLPATFEQAQYLRKFLLGEMAAAYAGTLYRDLIHMKPDTIPKGFHSLRATPKDLRHLTDGRRFVRTHVKSSSLMTPGATARKGRMKDSNASDWHAGLSSSLLGRPPRIQSFLAPSTFQRVLRPTRKLLIKSFDDVLSLGFRPPHAPRAL